MTMLSSLAKRLLKQVDNGELEELEIQLHTGNPGGEGKNNVATENTKKVWKAAAGTEGVNSAERANTAAIEWKAVKAKETYSFFSIRASGGAWYCNGEFNVPIAVEVGDTFVIPKELLKIKQQ